MGGERRGGARRKSRRERGRRGGEEEEGDGLKQLFERLEGWVGRGPVHGEVTLRIRFFIRLTKP